jgi:DNA invertase Pin-like site-specific DNA recombinase
MGVFVLFFLRFAVQAVGYVRTSSAANIGRDKDSERRQRLAIERFAKSAGYAVVDWFNDPAGERR